jgi:hypothetical protein
MSSTVRVAAMFLAAGGVLGVSLPGTAAAQEANNLGEKGELIVSIDRFMPLLSYTSETVTTTRNNVTEKTTDTGTSAAFLIGNEPNVGSVHTVPRVAFDYAVIKHLTVGGAFAFAFGLGGHHEEEQGNVSRKNDTPNNTIIGFAPRAGYVLPFHKNFAFWPRAGFGFYWTSAKTTTTNNMGVDTTTTNSNFLFSLDLDPQLAWVPVEHFFIHVGPLLNIPLTGSNSVEVATGSNTTTVKNDLSVFHFGLSAGLGGWFDL